MRISVRILSENFEWEFWVENFVDVVTQLIFTCSKSPIETLEKGVKYVQK